MRGIRGPRPEMLGHQSFQRLPVDLLRTVERPLRTQRPEHAGIEQVELLVRHGRALRTFHRQPERQQQVLQDADVPGDDLALDLAFPGDRRHVELCAVRKAHRLQKAGEAPDVAREPLRPHFLIEVQARVAAEDVRGIGCTDHQGQQPDAQRATEVELGQLRGHEGMHRAVRRPSAQQVHPATAELAGARTRQDEARWRRLLHDGMDYGQQIRDALDLVDDHRLLPRRSGEQLSQALGTGAQPAMELRFEQVDEQGVGNAFAQPRRLPGATGPEDEAATVRKLEESTYEFHFRSKSGYTASNLLAPGS